MFESILSSALTPSSTRCAVVVTLALSLGMTAVATAGGGDADKSKQQSAAGISSATLPYSSFLAPEVVQQLQQWGTLWKEGAKGEEACGQIDDATDAPRARQIQSCQNTYFYRNPQYQRIRSRYEVSISTQEIGGVLTEVFIPTSGVTAQNKDRVLINLHGGAFRAGSRTSSHLESIPVSAVARIKVVSVDYRLAPEFHFPAASKDVAAVYVELLKEYDPADIGIFGCSAGGLLTAQSVAWLQKNNLPLPGAVGMFCAGGSFWSEGDSGNFAALWEARPTTLRDDPTFEYMKTADFNDPLAYPVRSKQVMSRFPPSLLISSTRDLAMSSVVQTHSILVQQGVPAELYIWEGLPHAFIMDPDLPQSREAYEVTARFFDRYLGKSKDQLSRR